MTARPPVIRTPAIRTPAIGPSVIRTLAIRGGNTLAAMLVACLAVMLTAGPASAHAELVMTTPGNGSVLTTPPKQLVLRFSEAVEVGLGKIEVFGPNGKRIQVGQLIHPHNERETISATLRGPLTPGAHTVAWRLTSSDSHPVQGAFVFSVGSGTATPAPTPAPAGGPVPAQAAPAQATPGQAGPAQDGGGLVGVIFGITRAVAFAGLALLVGTSAFLIVCWPAGTTDPRARRLLRAGWFTLAAATGVGLLVYGPYAAQLPLGRMVSPSVLAETLSTRLGLAFGVRLLLLGLAAVGLAFLLRHPQRGEAAGWWSRWWRPLGVLVGASVLAATWSVANHSGVGVQAPFTMAADVVHLVAMSVWIGGLVAMAVVLLPARKAEAVRPAVLRFSTTALVCVCVLVVTGTYQSWRQVGSFSALAGTDYGGVLLLKLALVLLLVGLAVGARSWVRRQDQPAVAPLARRPWEAQESTPEVASLRRSVITEACVAGLVLALTAVLVDTEVGRTAYARAQQASSTTVAAPNGGQQTPTQASPGQASPTQASPGQASPGQASPGQAGPGQPTAAAPTVGPDAALATGAPEFKTLPFRTSDGPDGSGMIQVTFSPPRVGVSTMHLSVVDSQGRPKDPAELQVAVSLAKPSLGPVKLKMAKSGPGHYLSLPTFPLAGQWKLDVTVRTSEFDQVTVSTPVDIAAASKPSGQ
ncbi:copper resistance protein CopC [Actinopolymorpha alba]|uniref:copper resistance protein CopC n=1 Tax=Actinopolymorpha alba TaxID=533267 RepID=UPI00035E987C|nr:copper resistance protein CopC [Actinopolymorpha alba]